MGACGHVDRAVGEEVNGAGIAIGERSVHGHLTSYNDGGVVKEDGEISGFLGAGI